MKQLNMSLNASLSTRADDNPLREGMPELSPTFEIGPSIDIHLTDDLPGQGWMLRLPARAVVAFSEDGLEQVGWLFNPKPVANELYRRPLLCRPGLSRLLLFGRPGICRALTSRLPGTKGFQRVFQPVSPIPQGREYLVWRIFAL